MLSRESSTPEVPHSPLEHFVHCCPGFRTTADVISVTGLRVFATARGRESIADLNALGIETLSLEVDKPDSVRECRKAVEELTGGVSTTWSITLEEYDRLRGWVGWSMRC
jgi:hypothetical protein